MLDYATRVTVADCTIHDTAGDGIILYNTCDHITVSGCTIYDTDRNGISLTGSATSVRITGNSIWNVEAQPLDGEPDSGSIVGCIISDNDFATTDNDYAITICGRVGTPSSNWTVQNNRVTGAMLVFMIEDSVISGNIVDASAGTTPALHVTHYVDNVTISGNTFKATGTGYAGRITRTGGLEITRLNIMCNTFVGGSSRTLAIEGAKSFTVSNNTLVGPDLGYGIYVQFTAAMSAVRILDNYVTNVNRGIVIAPYSTNVCDYVSVRGNFVHDPKAVTDMAYGIQASAPSTSYGALQVSENHVKGATVPYDTVAGVAGPRTAFFGVKPIVQPTATPVAATDPATTQALVNDLRTKLLALGLIA